MLALLPREIIDTPESSDQVALMKNKIAATESRFPRAITDVLSLAVKVWKEGPTYVAYAPELDVSSCGRTASQAKSRLREAISLFVEESAKLETP